MEDEHKKSPISTKQDWKAMLMIKKLLQMVRTKTRALIDCGSMITCISEEFQSLNPIPELHSISEFGLTIHSANGTVLPYSGRIIDMCTLFW